MSFSFNVENVPAGANTDPDRKVVDWDARAKYLVDAVGTQKKAKAMIGIVSGVIDLGLQVQEDAKMLVTGMSDADQAAELAKNPDQYFEVLPDDKGVDQLYKRWKVKPCQQVAFTVDFPSIMINQSQFFGEDTGESHPLRMLMNGEFYMKDVGKVVGKPYNIKEVKQDDGSWGFKNNTQIYKLANATDVLTEQGHFKPNMIGELLGKAALFEVQVFTKESGGKHYLNEKIKLSGQVPDMMVPMIPELAPEYIYGVNFKGQQNPEVIKNLRQSVINTMKLAQNFEGSDIAKALEVRGNSSQPSVPAKEDKSVPEAKAETDSDDVIDDLPF